MFSAKDRMDFRYFHKRSHYLAVIAQSLQKPFQDTKSPMRDLEVEWSFTGGDTRRPCIVLRAGKGKFENGILLIPRPGPQAVNGNPDSRRGYRLGIPFIFSPAVEIPSPSRKPQRGAHYQLQFFHPARHITQIRLAPPSSTVFDIIARKRIGFVFGFVEDLDDKTRNQQGKGRKRMVRRLSG
jgi:hypothetical protein